MFDERLSDEWRYQQCGSSCSPVITALLLSLLLLHVLITWFKFLSFITTAGYVAFQIAGVLYSH